jgi:ribonuclease HII
MRRAVDGLAQVPDHALIDGNALPPELPCGATTVIKGDARCLSIAAASIIAKVARDRVMRDLSDAFPGYGWDANQGYPTAAHRAALLHLGVTPHHRRSFKPVHNILQAQAAQRIDSNK